MTILTRICSVQGCARKHDAKGLCAMHYQRKLAAELPEHKSYQNMLARCSSPNRPDYKYYGAKGITVCRRWRESYTNFIADMGPRPSAKHSIERVDRSRGYEPGNCVWATNTEQRINRGPFSNNTSGYRGVSWDKTHQRWVAYVRHEGKAISVGHFRNKAEAAYVRDQFALALHGPNAYLNVL